MEYISGRALNDVSWPDRALVRQECGLKFRSGLMAFETASIPGEEGYESAELAAESTSLGA